MPKHNVTVFRPYQFEVGQKIRIEGPRRGGDWEVVGIEDHKITLRCPLSHKEFTWEQFCYFLEEQKDTPWPLKD
jgi:hypothetical protein